jgi:hypothetical protein
VGATPAFRWNTGRIGYLVRNPFFRKPQIAGNNIQGSTNAEIMFIMFKRGREYERGRSSLSPELPSLAINICGGINRVHYLQSYLRTWFTD